MQGRSIQEFWWRLYWRLDKDLQRERERERSVNSCKVLQQYSAISKRIVLLSTEHWKQLITAQQLFSICDSKSCRDFLSSADNQIEWINLDQSKAIGIPSNKKSVLRVMKQQKLRSCEESGCRGHASSTLPDAFWTSSLSPQISVMWGASTANLMSYDTISQFIKLWYACPKTTKLQLFHLLLICLSKTSTAVLLRFKPDLGIWSQFPSQVPCKRPVVSPRISVSTEVPIGPPGPDSKTKLRSENALKKTNISGRLRGSQCSQTNLQMFHWIGPRFCAISVSY